MNAKPVPLSHRTSAWTRLLLGAAACSVCLFSFAGSAFAEGLIRSAPAEGVGAATIGVGNDIDTATYVSFPSDSRTLSRGGTLAYDGAAYGAQDVYAVVLYAGEVAQVTLTGQAGTDFGLWVFGPTATTTGGAPMTGSIPSHYGGPAGTSRSVTFTAWRSGQYYINPASWLDSSGHNGGTGSYTMDITVDKVVTAPSILPQTTQAFGTPAVISGAVMSRVNGEIPNGWVTLLYSTNGIVYMPLMRQQLTLGAFTFNSFLPGETNMYYQVQYEGTSAYMQSAGRTACLRYASLSGASASRAGKRKYNLRGSMAPAHTAGTRPVRIVLSRKVGRKWKSAGSVLAACADSPSGSSWSTTKKFSAAGKYRARTLHEDADHVATWGPYTYFTVR